MSWVRLDEVNSGSGVTSAGGREGHDKSVRAGEMDIAIGSLWDPPTSLWREGDDQCFADKLTLRVRDGNAALDGPEGVQWLNEEGSVGRVGGTVAEGINVYALSQSHL